MIGSRFGATDPRLPNMKGHLSGCPFCFQRPPRVRTIAPGQRRASPLLLRQRRAGRRLRGRRTAAVAQRLRGLRRGRGRCVLRVDGFFLREGRPGGRFALRASVAAVQGFRGGGGSLGRGGFSGHGEAPFHNQRASRRPVADLFPYPRKLYAVVKAHDNVIYHQCECGDNLTIAGVTRNDRRKPARTFVTLEPDGGTAG